MKKKQVTALLLAVVLMASLAACSQEEVQEETKAGIAVEVQTVTSHAISTENKVTGRVAADNEASIMVASASKCTAVYFNAGDTVEAGDIICTLDLGSTVASYRAAKIGYDSAVQAYQDQKSILDKQVKLASDNAENTKALFEIGAASQLEVDQAEISHQSAIASRNAALAQLEAGIQNAKSGLEQLGVVMDNVDLNGNVIAPISGTLVTMNAAEGSFVSASLPVAVISKEGQMKVFASVSEALVPKLAIGDTAEVEVSAAEQTFSAEIRSVERSSNMQTQLYTVVLTVPEEAENLLSGMFANITFHTDVVEQTIVVPTEAILTSNDIQYVYVVENDTARHVEVTTGLTGSGVTEIKSGLTDGMQLVTVGQAYLLDGDAVRIVSREG